MRPRKRPAVLGACIVFWLAAVPAASAETAADFYADFYKGKTVRLMIGSSAGGAFAFYSQMTATHLGKFLPGHPHIIVQSMIGASGNAALNHVYNVAPPDGTVMILPNLTLVQETLFNPLVRYNAREFHYIGRFTDVVGVAVASQRSGIKSLSDARQKQYSLGTVGTQNMTYWGPALMNAIGGTRFKLITGYAGTTELNLALQRGEADAFVPSWTTLKVNHADDLRDGKLVPIFGVAIKRIADLPDLPVVTEFGRTDTEKALLRILTLSNELGRFLAAPPKTPEPLVAVWRTAFDRMLADPAFRKEIAERGGDLNPVSGQELTKAVHETMDLPRETIDSARVLFEKLFSK